MADILMNRLGKTYAGGVRAVSDVSLSVADGEFVVLVGPSGCGKSTLLRMVAGLEAITDGTLHIGGRDVGRLEPAQRDIAMVFQNYALYPHMTVFDNLAYGLRNRGVPKVQIEQRVRKAAEVLEIAPLLERRPRALSGGQRQRVAMGRALVREPAAFLFDEPLSNLDARLRVQMRIEIRQLQRNLGTTALYVTHDQHEAMTLADRLVVLNAGRIEQAGAPMTLYERPETLFVAGFIGSPGMNLVPPALLRGGTVLAFPAGTDLLGIRPEDLSLAPRSDASVSLNGEARLFEPAGHEAMLYVSVAGVNQPVALRVGPAEGVAPGTPVTLHADPGKLHPFNSVTGRRTA